MTFRKSANPKTATIELRVTPYQKEVIVEEANLRMLSVSAFALRRMLGKQAPEQYDYHAILLLGELAAQLKELHRDVKGINEPLMQRVLDEIVVAITQLWKARSSL